MDAISLPQCKLASQLLLKCNHPCDNTSRPVTCRRPEGGSQNRLSRATSWPQPRSAARSRSCRRWRPTRSSTRDAACHPCTGAHPSAGEPGVAGIDCARYVDMNRTDPKGGVVVSRREAGTGASSSDAHLVVVPRGDHDNHTHGLLCRTQESFDVHDILCHDLHARTMR